MLWAFSIWLESVAILPQLFMLQRTGEAETITTHYLFALGAYRALYIPNWMYRYFTEGHFDAHSVFAGIIQTILYSDFFWIYYTKCASRSLVGIGNTDSMAGSSKARNSIFPCRTRLDLTRRFHLTCVPRPLCLHRQALDFSEAQSLGDQS